MVLRLLMLFDPFVGCASVFVAYFLASFACVAFCGSRFVQSVV